MNLILEIFLKGTTKIDARINGNTFLIIVVLPLILRLVQLKAFFYYIESFFLHFSKYFFFILTKKIFISF